MNEVIKKYIAQKDVFCDAFNFFLHIVIAQSGFIGTLAFVIVLILFFKMAFKAQKSNLYIFWAQLSILAYEIISSTSEPSFFNPSVCVLFFAFGIATNILEIVRKREK